MKMIILLVLVYSSLFSALEHDLKNRINFTSQEIEYINNREPIKICVLPNSRPYSAIENGEYIGLGAEILKSQQAQLNLKYKLIIPKSLAECELMPLADSSYKKKEFTYTTSFHEEPIVFVTDKSNSIILNITTLLDKHFSVQKGHALADMLRSQYPSIKLELVNSTKDGLEGVEEGKYYAHIDTLLAITYAFRNKNYSDLYIAGELGKKAQVSFAVRKDDKILFNIFEKIAQNMDAYDIQVFLERSKQTREEVFLELEDFRNGLIVLAALFLLFVFRQFTLSKKNQELESLQERLIHLNFQLEEKVNETLNDLDEAQSVAKIGSWVYELDTKSLAFSEQTYEIFGFKKNLKSTTKDLYKLYVHRIHPDDLQMVADAYTSATENKNFDVKYRIVMDDESIKHIHELGKIKFNNLDEAIISYGTMQDITKSVKVNMELKKQNAFVVHQSRLAQMGEMLSMISHQWKQPLSAISATEIAIRTTLALEKYDLSDEQGKKDFTDYLEEKLKKIALYTHSLAQTISDFSSFYQPSNKTQKASLDEVVSKTFNLVRDGMKASFIDVRFQLDAKRELMIHENELMQVLLSLLNNAQDQLKNQEITSPYISIRTYENENAVVLEVEDNAGGIPQDIIGKIFDPYFSTKLEKNGTGLGLYMAKMVVTEHHAGEMSVTNTEDGACFMITINKSEEEK